MLVWPDHLGDIKFIDRTPDQLGIRTVEERLQSSHVNHVFCTKYANIVGSMLDQFVAALRMLDAVDISHLDRPRIIDFAILGEAVSMANGSPAGAFIEHYKLMRSKGVHRTIDLLPIGSALLSFMQSHTSGWSGQLNALLTELSRLKANGEHNWPRSAQVLGDKLTPSVASAQNAWL